MAPSKNSCESLSKSALQWIDFVNKIKRLNKIRKEISLKKLKLKFGLTDIVDYAGTVMVEAIEAVALKVTDQIIGATSQAASTAFNAIFTSILKIVLAFPTALFSLVSIPHERALFYSMSERKYLARSNIYLRNIINIATRWAVSQEGANYYNKMRHAMQYIDNALQLSSTILNGLEGTVDKIDDQKEPHFDEESYIALQKNLHKAVEITQPDSSIVRGMNFQQAIESDRQKLYKQKAKMIDEDYKNKKNVITQNYLKDLREISPTSVEGWDISQALKLEKRKYEYDFQLRVLDNKKSIALDMAKAESAVLAATNGSNYIKAANGLAGQFSYDMNMIMQNVQAFADSINEAYRCYDKKHSFCNTIYYSRTLIKQLLTAMLGFIRSSSSASIISITEAVESAQTLIDMSKEKFTDSMNKYSAPDKDISDCGLANALAAGHEYLVASDHLLDIAVTKGLIDVLNSPNVLEDSSGQYDEFLARLAAIKDFDGKSNIWAVNLDLCAAPPYIELIVEALSMTVKIPAAVASTSSKAKKNLSVSVAKTEQLFRVASMHNSAVYDVLHSYTPYVGSEYGNLTSLLSKAGMLDDFAEWFNIIAVTSKIAIAAITDSLDADPPTLYNCKVAYPELFANPAFAQYSAMQTANNPSAFIDKGKQEVIELNAEDLKGLNYEIMTTDFNFNRKIADLKNNTNVVKNGAR